MPHPMEDLLRRLYGRKSEKLESSQLLLEKLILSAGGEGQRREQPEALGAADEIAGQPVRKRRRRSGRQPLPDHPPRKEMGSGTGYPLRFCWNE
jgi:hypothetical protein